MNYFYRSNRILIFNYLILIIFISFDLTNKCLPTYFTYMPKQFYIWLIFYEMISELEPKKRTILIPIFNCLIIKRKYVCKLSLLRFIFKTIICIYALLILYFPYEKVKSGSLKWLLFTKIIGLQCLCFYIN